LASIRSAASANADETGGQGERREIERPPTAGGSVHGNVHRRPTNVAATVAAAIVDARPAVTAIGEAGIVPIPVFRNRVVVTDGAILTGETFGVGLAFIGGVS
jgi:hypothetical protein